MAELACVYDAAPVPRTPQDVISTPAQKRRKNKAQARKPKQKGKPREPQAPGKWLTASVTDDIPAVIAAAFDEAERRDPARQREWVVLIDGNSTQIEAVTAEATTRGVTVTIVIDFIHVLEGRLVLLRQGRAGRQEWVADQARKILHGKARQVVDAHLKWFFREFCGAGYAGCNMMRLRSRGNPARPRVCGEIFFAARDGQFPAAIAWYFVRRAWMASGDSGLPWRVQNKGRSGLVPRC